MWRLCGHRANAAGSSSILMNLQHNKSVFFSLSNKKKKKKREHQTSFFFFLLYDLLCSCILLNIYKRHLVFKTDMTAIPCNIYLKEISDCKFDLITVHRISVLNNHASPTIFFFFSVTKSS